MAKRVLVIGASNNEERYSNKAQRLLAEHGHEVIPVTPKETEVLGVKTIPDIARATGPVDTVSVYVRPQVLKGQADALVRLKPNRVIFNPGTEDEAVEAELKREGIEVVEGCTLVMLRTDQF